MGAGDRGHVALRAAAWLLLGLAAFRIAVSLAGEEPDHPAHDARFSLLALGDTGKRHRPFGHATEPQLSVAADLVAEARAHRVDALLLLGDNFYMRGLRAEELVPRLRMNLVLPYCGLVALEAPRSEEVSGVCAGARARSVVPRIYALLGNHDYLTRESPALQRDAIPRYVANWELSTDAVRSSTVASGIDLIRLDATQIESEGGAELHRAALVEALQDSRGPWRVVVSHAGGAVGDEGGPPSASSTRGRFAAFFESAVEEAGVPVQLLLAGHHHSLQAVAGKARHDAALHVIAGSGARAPAGGRASARPLPKRVARLCARRLAR